eukprot:646696-Rhodomonas_salina.3
MQELNRYAGLMHRRGELKEEIKEVQTELDGCRDGEDEVHDSLSLPSFLPPSLPPVLPPLSFARSLARSLLLSRCFVSSGLSLSQSEAHSFRANKMNPSPPPIAPPPALTKHALQILMSGPDGPPSFQ